MKKATIFLLVFTYIIYFKGNDLYANTFVPINFEKDIIRNEEDYSIILADTIIIGNPVKITKEDCDTIKHDLKDKYLFVYHFKLIQDLKEEFHASFYYYSNGELKVEQLKSYSETLLDVQNDILNFYEEKKLKAQSSTMTQGTQTVKARSSLLNLIYSNANLTLVKSPYAKIELDYVVYKYRASSYSSLYLVETYVRFIPGVAIGGNYDKWRNNIGIIDLQLSPAESYGYYGAMPFHRDSYPVTSPSSVLMEDLLTYLLGYSNPDGLYILGKKEYSYSKTYNSGGVFKYTKFADFGPGIYGDYAMTTVSWRYEYSKSVTTQHNMKVGFLFEMRNGGHQLSGENNFKLNYKFFMNMHKNSLISYTSDDWSDTLSYSLYQS